MTTPPRSLLDDYLNLSLNPTQAQQSSQPVANPPVQISQAATPQQQAAIESWNKNIVPAVQQGAQQGAQAARDTNSLAAGSSDQLQNLVDPLAVQLFFQQAISPMLQNLQQRLVNQNADFTRMAQANLEHFQMPEAYKAIFGQSIPRQAAAQNDVLAALSGAAAAGPALDQLMSAIGQARSAAYQDYQARQAGAALGATSLQQTLDALAGQKTS